jgi:hypothetical protein
VNALFVTHFFKADIDTAMPIKFRKVFAAFAGAVVAFATASHGANPFITSIYTADPSAHVWSDGRLYVYPSHDMDPPRGCDLMDRYHVFSTADMVNWRDEGEILRASQIFWGRLEGGFMWAPDCACKDGTYYLYFPHPSGSNWNKTWKIGVATSSEPASNFKPVGFIGGLDENAMIDPAVFTDADGRVYFYYGGGGVCKGGRLKPNMIEIDGAMQNMTGLFDFHEATWVFKRATTYYLTYADNFPGSNRMRYATSTSPLGPWTHRGIYLEPTGCDTTHGSVVQFRGQWYQFYHNQSLSGRGNLRSMCVDKINFNEDGTIQMVMQTKTGVPSAGPALAPKPATTKYEVRSALVGNGAKLAEDVAASGAKSAHELHLENSYLQFDRVSGGNNGGRATIGIHYATNENAKLKLLVNGVDFSFVNTPATGDWEAYQGLASLTVPLGPGTTNTIKLVGGHGGANVDYITVSPLP